MGKVWKTAKSHLVGVLTKRIEEQDAEIERLTAELAECREFASHAGILRAQEEQNREREEFKAEIERLREQLAAKNEKVIRLDGLVYDLVERGL